MTLVDPPTHNTRTHADALLRPDNPSHRRALLAGVVAGPLFVAVSFVQIPSRPGFDVTKHAFSFLELGQGGWVQSLNFAVTGLLLVASGVGLRRAIGGSAGTLAQVLVTGVGGGMVAAGLFPPGAYRGYPTTTPVSAPLSGNGPLHAVAFSVAMLCWCALLLVLAHWFARQGRGRPALAASVAAVGLVLVPVTTGQRFDTVLLYVAATAAFLTTAGLFAVLRTFDGE
ncbi:MAG: DUF998 domain-containing protein [Kineosporiaceae bacterium]